MISNKTLSLKIHDISYGSKISYFTRNQNEPRISNMNAVYYIYVEIHVKRIMYRFAHIPRDEH